MIPFGDKFKLARKHLSKTQAEMAETVGISKRGWQTYEEEKSVPGGNVFRALSELGFNVSWFFSDDVPMLLGDEHSSQQSPANGQPAANREFASDMPSDKLGLGESVELLAKIYNSGNKVLIRAIAANLNAFGEAIDNKVLAQKAIDMMDEMNKRMFAMEKDLAILKEENEELKKTRAPNDLYQATG